MKKAALKVNGYEIVEITVNTVIVGSGAAGYNAADRLYTFGVTDIAIVTEGKNAGTSRNTGSDKQTYYKLSLSGGDRDSVLDMANTLFGGGGMDGDVALAEAALSARCFMRLVELGVPFPTNRYGEYIGYKTDHDPCRRATSAGPLTSKLMTEALEHAVGEKGIPVFDGLRVVCILTEGGEAAGVLCLEGSSRFVLFRCGSIIWATGGPAGMYADSVYPLCHTGASGVALEAGTVGKGLTDWQHGLASVRPRWNVSGTYMQALPRFISIDKDGREHEFLRDFDSGILSKIFLKGYEWPFDVRKVSGGSSVIDLLVFVECKQKNRRVFLDYRLNPYGGECFDRLDPAAREYLQNAGATSGTPVERLIHMNAPAYEFYLDHGVDLKNEPLEIALCAQHNNGGLAVDMWWQTNIRGLFAVGEAAGTHGVYRPGGSALNAGQVGGLRAAMYISRHGKAEPLRLSGESTDKISRFINMAEAATGGGEHVDAVWNRTRASMSLAAGAIWDCERIERYSDEVGCLLEDFSAKVGVSSAKELEKLFRLYDMLISQAAYLSAMLDYIRAGGKSRGSAMIIDKGGNMADESFPEFIFSLDGGERAGLAHETFFKSGAFRNAWRDVRPIPESGGFFENIWRDYRASGNVF